MKVVSYTRAVSCRAKDENPAGIIGIQNEHIGQYARAHGWKLAMKYSDRKFSPEEAAAFEQMVEDGLDRRYDCVAVDSVFRFGRKFADAVSILQKTFYPAGIYFVIVEDDFFSMGKSAQEIDDYFAQKRMKLVGDASWERWRELEKEGVMVKVHLSYGYLLSEDRKHMVADESVAHIIRRIFQWSLSGMNGTEIANRLNDEGVMSPQEHMTRVFGSEPNFIADSIWRSGTIRRMLENPIYMGKAKRKVGGVDTVIDVPPIISEELYLQVQEMMKPRKPRVRTWDVGNANILNKRIYDKETGKAMMCLKSPFDETDRVFALKKRFRYLSREDQRCCISYRVVMAEITDALKREKALVAQVDGLLQTEEAETCLEKELAGCRMQARELLNRMNAVYGQRMEIHKLHEDGQISAEELASEEDACQVELMKCEQEFKLIMEQADERRTVYSRVNPWLTLYRDIEVPDKLERKHIRQWLGLVAVDHFQAVEVGMKEQEWKAKLPEEWLALRTEE